jgi:hypothetical protein
MSNSVRSLTVATERVAAKGRYTLVRVEPDTKYQGSEHIVIGQGDIERPPILTGVVVSTGPGRFSVEVFDEADKQWCRKLFDPSKHSLRTKVWEPSPYTPGDRVQFCRGEGYAAWKETDDEGVATEYRMLDTFEQVLGYVLEGEARTIRAKLACQHGVMD